MSSAGRSALVVVLLLGLVLVLALVAGESLYPGPADTSLPGSDRPVPSADGPAIETPSPSAPLPERGSPAARPGSSPDPPPPESARRYRDLTRYPTSTRRLTEDSFDLLNPGARHERRMPIPDQENNSDQKWQVRFTADRYFVRGDESTVVSLELWREGTPVLPTSVEMFAEAVVSDSRYAPIVLDPTPDGVSTRAIFTPDLHWPSLVGSVRVTAIFSATDLPPQVGTLDFYFTGSRRIPARFTGGFADRLLDGSLLIDVEVEVETPGLYRVEGNLFDATGRPFGWARFDGNLSRGVQSLPLVFYGLLFHDAEAVAPFTLQQIHGHRVRLGDAPHREDMAPFQGEYRTTTPYEVEDFRSDENDTPHKRRMMELYRDAEERGVRFTTPGFVGANPWTRPHQDPGGRPE